MYRFSCSSIFNVALLKSTGIDHFSLQLASWNFLSRIFLRNRFSRYTSIALRKIMEIFMYASLRVYRVRSAATSDHFDVCRVTGGREGIFGRARFEICRSLQDALRRCPWAARGTTPARNKRFRPNAQHPAHHQSFTAHLRAREILGEQIPHIRFYLPPSRASILSFYCFCGRHNAVIGWHIVACLSPRFLLITLLPWHFAKLLSKGQNSREEHVQLIQYEHLSLFPTAGDNFVTRKIVRRSRVYTNRWNTNVFMRLKLRFNNFRNDIHEHVIRGFSIASKW